MNINIIIKGKVFLLASFFLSIFPGISYGECYALLPPEYSGAPYEITIPKNNCAWINPGINLNEGLNYKFNLTNVYDGMFGVKTDEGWGFYFVEGGKLFSNSWVREMDEDEYYEPHFSNGALLMYKKADPKEDRPLYLLKKDGTIKELSKDYIFPTNYVDGLSVVTKKNGERVFLDTNGNEVYTHLKIGDNHAWPLVEGLRLFKEANGIFSKYGYLDSQGNIKIKPQWEKAESFHDGLAPVYDKEIPNYYYINTKGEMAFPPKWEFYGMVLESLGPCWDGICAVKIKEGYDDYHINYYDRLGNNILTVDNGGATPYYYGYAWMTDKIGTGHSEVWVRDPKGLIFDVERENEVDFIEVMFNTKNPFPNFGESGIAVYGKDLAYLPCGRILLKLKSSPWDAAPQERFLSEFSPEKYCKAEIVIDEKPYIALINSYGEAKVIFMH